MTKIVSDELDDVDFLSGAINEAEQGKSLTVEDWVRLLRLSCTHNTVLTVGTLRDRLGWADRFVTVAPDPGEVNVSTLFVKRVAETWSVFAEYTVGVDFPAPLVRVAKKFSELTGLVVTDTLLKKLDLDEQLNFVSSVQVFYDYSLMYEHHELMGTVFALGEAAPMDILGDIADHRLLPAHVIEEYAFTVPKFVAEKFVAHPNCPSRLRVLIQVALPHMP